MQIVDALPSLPSSGDPSKTKPTQVKVELTKVQKSASRRKKLAKQELDIIRADNQAAVDAEDASHI